MKNDWVIVFVLILGGFALVAGLLVTEYWKSEEYILHECLVAQHTPETCAEVVERLPEAKRKKYK